MQVKEFYYESLGLRELKYHKGPETFIFRYRDGQEALLLDIMIDQASDLRTVFDPVDAAFLSFKLTGSMIGRIDEKLSEADLSTSYSNADPPQPSIATVVDNTHCQKTCNGLFSSAYWRKIFSKIIKRYLR